jgi:hypothetical protein
MIVQDALSRYVPEAKVAVPDDSKLRWDTYMMLGHQGWKVGSEHLSKERTRKGIWQEI